MFGIYIWPNRTYPEYGVPVLGEDCNQELARYLKARFEIKGPLMATEQTGSKLSFMVWERKHEDLTQ
jgi:hypothetical protein